MTTDGIDLTALPAQHPETGEPCDWEVTQGWAPVGDETDPSPSMEIAVARDRNSGLEARFERRAP